jgi:hypothetical protein
MNSFLLEYDFNKSTHVGNNASLMTIVHTNGTMLGCKFSSKLIVYFVRKLIKLGSRPDARTDIEN